MAAATTLRAAAPSAAHIEAMRACIVARSSRGLLVPSPAAIARLVEIAFSGERIRFAETTPEELDLCACTWLDWCAPGLLEIQPEILGAFLSAIGGAS